MPLYAEQRKQAILTTLAAAGRVDVAAMSEQLAVTSETVRKDLIALERQGRLRRVHGGAIPLQKLSFEPEVTARVEFAEEKRRIARAALAHLPRSGTILIDAGSTTALLAELIPPDRPLTAFTNTLPIALALAAKPHVTVYTLGGRVRNVTLAEVDAWAARTLGEINVDVAFLGTNGITADHGLTTPDPDEAAVKRAIVGCGHLVVALADASKFGVETAVRFAAPAEVDVVITDDGASSADRRSLSDAGVEVQIA